MNNSTSNSMSNNNNTERPKPKYKVGQTIKYKNLLGSIDEVKWCDWLNFYEGWYYRISYGHSLSFSSDAGVKEYEITLVE